MSNVLESGGSPEEGNSISHWLWNNAFGFRTRSFGALFLSHICNVVAGGILEYRYFLKTFVPPSTSNRASLVPFDFSSEAVRGEDIFMTLVHAPEQMSNKTCQISQIYFCGGNLHSLVTIIFCRLSQSQL